MVGNISKGHNRPPNPLLLRAFSHPRETQHKNKLLLHTANIKVFLLLADTYFGKCLRAEHKDWVLSFQELQFGHQFLEEIKGCKWGHLEVREGMTLPFLLLTV